MMLQFLPFTLSLVVILKQLSEIALAQLYSLNYSTSFNHMTHKNFSFWLCTLLSGVVIGIASQRIPEASDSSKKAFQPHPYSFYCTGESPLSSQPLSSFQIHKAGYDARHRVPSRVYDREESFPGK
jgi:hypothetical protein